MIFGKHINKYYLKYAWLLTLGIMSLFLVDYMQLKVPEFYRMTANGLNTGTAIVNGATVKFDMNVLLDEICMPLILVILCMITGRFIWRICFFGAGNRLAASMRGELFAHCRELSQNFYSRNKVGDLMSLYTNDMETIEECFKWGILMFVDAVSLGIMAMIKMFRVNPVLTLAVLCPMGLLLAVTLILKKLMTGKWDARQAAFSKLSDFSQESFSGISVIKAFVTEMKEIKAFDEINKTNEDTNVDYTKISTLLKVLVRLFIETSFGIIFGIGGILVFKGKIDAGQLIEFSGYFDAIIWPVTAVSELVDQSSRGKASLIRISKILDEPVDVKDREGITVPDKEIEGKIEFRGLTFAFPGTNHNALENITLTIEKGENIGIIGKTGCGKTTLCDLILRTYNVPYGTLLVDDIDVNDLPIEYLRTYEAYVPQDNFLFSDTIANNVAFAVDDKNIEKIKESADISDVAKDIEEFPHKYKTVLGERGVTVSGGQKQRISIARAVMKDAPIMILDDSVSAVDTDTEKRILGKLKALRSGKTTILIEHRVSTVMNMDKIIYMNDGKVVDFGSHDELYERCEEYRRTCDLQNFMNEKGGDLNA